MSTVKELTKQFKELDKRATKLCPCGPGDCEHVLVPKKKPLHEMTFWEMQERWFIDAPEFYRRTKSGRFEDYVKLWAAAKVKALRMDWRNNKFHAIEEEVLMREFGLTEDDVQEAKNAP